MASLYERLGGSDGLKAIASDTVDLHLDNPRIAPRYVNSDVPAVKESVAAFFIENSGGPSVYKGKDMLAAHRGMNIDHAEFMAAIDDALAALDKNGIGQREKEEVLFFLYGFREQVVRV